MDREYKAAGVKIKVFRGDNDVYTSTEFRAELKNDRKLIFCGIGAYRQNGIAKRYNTNVVEKHALCY